MAGIVSVCVAVSVAVVIVSVAIGFVTDATELVCLAPVAVARLYLKDFLLAIVVCLELSD